MNWDDTYARIVDDESFRTDIYLDSLAKTKDYPNGIPTVGPGLALLPGYEIPVGALNIMANAKFRKCVEAFDRFEAIYDLELDSVRRSVITEMIWNMGLRGVCRFARMIAAMQIGDWPEAGVQILDSAVHRKLSEIRGKRKFRVRTEVWAEMMETGEEI